MLNRGGGHERGQIATGDSKIRRLGSGAGVFMDKGGVSLFDRELWADVGLG